MKTLLYICNPAAATNANISSSSSTSAVVGLASTSFAFYNNAVTELNFKAQGDNNDENPNVQCVDAFLTEDKLLVAVVKFKTVAVFTLTPGSTSPTATYTFTVPKKVSCVKFITEKDYPMMILVGDKAGDVTSYSTSPPQKSKHIVGHTASMITCLSLSSGPSPPPFILSGDRDEKIRVTNFPNTYVLENILLGHTGYITSLSSNETRCVSSSGDSTVRFWDYKKPTEEALLKTLEVEGVPSVTAISPSNVIAFAIDGGKEVNIVSPNSSPVLKINVSASILGLTFSGNDELFVLTSSPSSHLSVFSTTGSDLTSSTPLAVSLNLAAASVKGVPSVLIEGENANGGSEKSDAALVKRDKHHTIEKRLNDKGGKKKQKTEEVS
ncbi:hypothetical protein TrVE_jg1593 [Triparma verrucosa]|uniref:WD repeat-containing protein 4 homolog n=1 Tax=Triparma verrucosa TaxID=1606542 RepID=A0A9W7C1N9_9STRA|nr:hypothetical protein TrVE_jg1593 [Triparma verrucosa]